MSGYADGSFVPLRTCRRPMSGWCSLGEGIFADKISWPRADWLGRWQEEVHRSGRRQLPGTGAARQAGLHRPRAIRVPEYSAHEVSGYSCLTPPPNRADCPMWSWSSRAARPPRPWFGSPWFGWKGSPASATPVCGFRKAASPQEQACPVSAAVQASPVAEIHAGHLSLPVVMKSGPWAARYVPV